MADKEVQISKSQAVSAVSGGKKLTTTSSKVPVQKPGHSSASTSTTSSVSTKMTTKEANPAHSQAPMRELAEILRELNSNLVAQSDRIDKHNQVIGSLVTQWNEPSSYTDDYQYDDCEQSQYDDDDYEYPEQSENESVVNNVQNQGSIFRQMSNKFQQSEPLDTNVHPDLAELVNNSFRNGLPEDGLDELCKNIHRPANCDALVKTRVNQGIWRLLKSFTQSEDSRLTAIQGVMLKATVNIVKLLEKLGSSDSEHVELGTTAVALLGQANKMINTKRKDLHKTDLDSKYHYLASASLPYTDLLYGNDTDVNNNVREINTMNKIGKGSGRGGFGRGQGRGRRGYSPYPARGRGFRGRGRGGPLVRPETSGVSKNNKPQKK